MVKKTGISKQETINTITLVSNKHVVSIYCVPGMVLRASFVAGAFLNFFFAFFFFLL